MWTCQLLSVLHIKEVWQVIQAIINKRQMQNIQFELYMEVYSWRGTTRACGYWEITSVEANTVRYRMKDERLKRMLRRKTWQETIFSNGKEIHVMPYLHQLKAHESRPFVKRLASQDQVRVAWLKPSSHRTQENLKQALSKFLSNLTGPSPYLRPVLSLCYALSGVKK